MDDTACRPALQNQPPLAKTSETSVASTSGASGAGSSSIPFPFSRLPYDVRAIVYSYLETGQPLAPRFECLGFYLSCRQYRRDIEEFARDRLRRLCAKIENTLSVKVAIKRGLNELRSITVVLPYTAFDGLSSYPRWKREVLSSLHPLFAYPFDMLRVHISSEQCPTLSAQFKYESTWRSLIQDLGSVIEYSNTYNHQAHSVNDRREKFEEIFEPGSTKDDTPYPSAEVTARRICLSWDRRPSPRGDVQLSGRLIYADESYQRHAFRMEKNQDPLNPANPQTAIVYELRSAEYPIGEIGIVSSMRWPRYEFGESSVTDMIRSFDLRRGTIVSSEGLGMQLENGLAGVRVQKLEDEEDRRYKAALDRKFDDDVIRACIEEGYMPY